MPKRLLCDVALPYPPATSCVIDGLVVSVIKSQTHNYANQDKDSRSAEMQSDLALASDDSTEYPWITHQRTISQGKPPASSHRGIPRVETPSTPAVPLSHANSLQSTPYIQQFNRLLNNVGLNRTAYFPCIGPCDVQVVHGLAPHCQLIRGYDTCTSRIFVQTTTLEVKS